MVAWVVSVIVAVIYMILFGVIYRAATSPSRLLGFRRRELRKLRAACLVLGVISGLFAVAIHPSHWIQAAEFLAFLIVTMAKRIGPPSMS